MDQWEERVRAFVPSARVGRIQGSICDVHDKDIVIAMIQSVATRDYDVLDTFGMAIFDEAHHMAAPVFFRVVTKIRCAHVLSVTATDVRPDGLTQLLRDALGDVSYRATARETPQQCTVEYVGCMHGIRDVVKRDGSVCTFAIDSWIAKCRRRTCDLVGIIQSAHGEGRHILVLSSRCSHLTTLRDQLLDHGVSADNVSIFTGATRRKDREQCLTCNIVLSTYQMAKEGLDVKTLDTLVLATPVCNVEQAVGRIQRPCDTKKAPTVYDVVDTQSMKCMALWSNRKRFYTSKGYNIKTSEYNQSAQALE